MNFVNLFEQAFKTKCILTDHAILRLKQRFLYSELIQLKYLIQAALRKCLSNKWSSDEEVVLINPRKNFSILCTFYPKENITKVITLIRGKTPESYNNCRVISVSITKEKSDQEVDILNQYRFSKQKIHV